MNVVVASTDPIAVDNDFGSFAMVVHTVRGPDGLETTEVSLVIEPLADPCLVRMQSACLNAEAFGDTRCACKGELDAALIRIHEARSGVLVYSPGDDGRGAGLFGKVQAMAVRERLGISDLEARQTLGVAADRRSHATACAVLWHLGVRRVELMSASAAKEQALTAAGIAVVGQVEGWARAASI